MGSLLASNVPVCCERRDSVNTVHLHEIQARAARALRQEMHSPSSRANARTLSSSEPGSLARKIQARMILNRSRSSLLLQNGSPAIFPLI
jgi:hypothetical protein